FGQGLRAYTLLDRGVGADGETDVLTAQAPELLGNEQCGLVPIGGHQVAATPDERRQEAAWVIYVLVAEAGPVVDPGLVDFGVEFGFDELVAGGPDVDAKRAVRRVVHAGRAGVVVLPVAAAEAVGGVEQRPHRADVGDIAGEVAGQARVGGADVGVR